MEPKIHGPEVWHVGFYFERDANVLPQVYVCPHPECPVILTIAGLRIVHAGHVTCLRCLRPMYLTGETVH